MFKMQIHPLYNARGIVRRVKGVGDQAASMLEQGVVRIAERVREHLEDHTPRFDPSTKDDYEVALWDGEHIADYWQVNVRQQDRFRHVTMLDILNTHPRANKKIRGHNLLEMLEYGTKKHDIVPRLKPLLVFFYTRFATVVKRKIVHHPGTQGVHFMFDARMLAQEWGQDLRAQVESFLRRELIDVDLSKKVR
jgi:hypothetical protein